MTNATVATRKPEKKQDGIPVLPDGSMVLSPEFFKSVVKTAVKEAVSEVVSEFGLDRKPQQYPIPKLKKPNNWEYVCCLYRMGQIGSKRAAKMAGISESSFHRYYSGKARF